MALFENFPYTNLHELNLDWIINELNRIKESTVLSVNGQTGDVILYENATVQFPNVPEDHWSIIRLANGTERGILFGNDNKAYIVHGGLMNELYAQNNQPPYPVTSVNGQTGDIVLYAQNTVRLPDLDDISLHNWNIFRELNNNFLGIEFNEDGTASIIFNTIRDNIYTVNNPPPYPVTSVNGKTGAVNLFNDNNGIVAFPGIDDPNITGWIVGRSINNTPCYIQLNDDGTLEVTAGLNNFRVYTTDDTSADVINVPTDASSDAWGLIRDTSEGSVGILFSNDPLLTTPEAYVRYVDSMDVVHTEKLLTAADIPSASGVVSFNGQTGIVVIKGSDLIVSTTDTRTIAQAISDSALTDYAIKGAVAYVENTNTATQNIPSGAYVIWKNDDYISIQAISIGDTLSGTNLSALSAGGITNTLKNDFNTLNNNVNKLNSNATLTYDILADAINVTRTQFFKASGGNYTGTVPNNTYKYGVFLVFKRNAMIFVLAIAENRMALNKYESGTWSGWKDFRAIKTATETGSTDTGGNRLIAINYIDIINADCVGYMCIPFHLNGRTYIKVLNYADLTPVASTSLTFTYSYLDE